VLEFARPYTPDLVGWFRDFGQGAANYDANGHYARIQPIFNAFQFTDNPAGGQLTPIPPSARMTGLSTGNERRCPGAATQAPPDGSAPFTDGGNVEHMWLTPVTYDGSKFAGTVNNEPEKVKSVKWGQKVTVAPDKISDWMYIWDRKLVGGETLRVLRSAMTPAERAEFDRSVPFTID
jgi:hypothetical protein